ncbi:MAG: SDR family NAD(P)-dependent oxidoreductase [Pseudomonadota bacterium]|nr:SDR family NAD(P)-dependent oxidoreductase [Pseudomonadota bacterium]
MSKSMRGKRAVITGGAQGIGYAIAEKFLSQGAQITLWDQDEALMAEAVDTLGEGASGVAVDVTNPDMIEAAAREAQESVGGIDVLVNNAGIAGAALPVCDYPLDEWRRVIEIDLNGVFYCCRAVVPVMVAQDYGRIVNIASIAGKEGNPNASAYSAAKAGVIALTKSLGKELAETGVRVNCITPAAAKTRIFEQITQEHIDYMLSKIPMARFVEVEEIAELVAWLSSDACAFSTGAVFDISGGRATY